MNCKEISLEDKTDIEEAYRKAGICDCDLAFSNLICWKDSYPAQICRVDGFIVIRACFDAEIGVVYTVPLGSGDPSHIFKMIEEDAASMGTSPKIMIPSEQAIESFHLIYPDLGFFFQRSHSDYIYDRKDLATLQGKKFQAKRNHVNKFKSSYNFTYSSLTADDAGECIELLQRWREQRLSEGSTPDSFIEELDKEEASIRTAFSNFDTLDIIGGALRVGGSMVAFSYGTALSDEMFCVHIEKADESLDGVFAAINQQLVEHLPSNFLLVNRENDLGLQGLRRAKESYHPSKVLNKYIALKMSPLMLQIRRLWLDCFVQDSFLDADQFLLTRFREELMLSHHDGEKMVSMLHIIPFGRSAYIYAVATDPSYRHKGIAGELIRKALERCRDMGFDEALLIPENQQSSAWYASFGFSGRYPVRFNTVDEFDFFATCDDYDYGMGDITLDYAMICPLSPHSPHHPIDEPIILSDIS